MAWAGWGTGFGDCNNTKIDKILLSAGANPKLTDDRGMTALDWMIREWSSIRKERYEECDTYWELKEAINF